MVLGTDRSAKSLIVSPLSVGLVNYGNDPYVKSEGKLKYIKNARATANAATSWIKYEPETGKDEVTWGEKYKFRPDKSTDLVTRIFLRLDLKALAISAGSPTYERYIPDLMFKIFDGLTIRYNQKELQVSMGEALYHWWLHNYLKGEEEYLDHLQRNAGIGDTLGEANARSGAAHTRSIEIPLFSADTLCRALEINGIATDQLEFVFKLPSLGDVIHTDGTVPTSGSAIRTQAGINALELWFEGQFLDPMHQTAHLRKATDLKNGISTHMWDANISATKTLSTSSATHTIELKDDITHFANYLVLFFNVATDIGTSASNYEFRFDNSTLRSEIPLSTKISLKINNQIRLLDEIPLEMLKDQRLQYDPIRQFLMNVTPDPKECRVYAPRHRPLPHGVVVIPLSAFSDLHPDYPNGGVNFTGHSKVELTVALGSTPSVDLNLRVMEVYSNYMTLINGSYKRALDG